jgi:hypothetical protein
VGLFGCAVGRAGDFFPTRDENPLVRGFYLPLAAESRGDAGAVFAATLSLANTLNVENAGHESVLVDGESDTLRLSFADSLSTHWRYRLTLPVIHDGGGFLDSTIDAWHRWFGFQSGYRPFYPQGRIDYSYSGFGVLGVHEAHTGLGDLSAETGWYAVDDANRTVALWGGLAAPTGSVSHLTGDGAWDTALWAHVAQRFARWQLAAELGVAQPLGDELYEGHGHRTSGFSRLAATYDLNPAWALRAQLDGQTGRVADSAARLLGPSLQLTLGAAVRVSSGWRLEFGFAEDAAVNTAPDITFFLALHD